VTVLSNTAAETAPAPATNQVAGQHGKGKAGRNVRVVYLLDGDEHTPVLRRVQVKTGITDGIFTEITDGLNEGDKVVTGSTGGETQNAAQSANPFGGGGFPRGR
jgi:HlyD family secretion protein